ncbi:MAG: hypothetical protein LUI09_00860 [Prevotellaceae bacterium]|nr:hypothetical protein [Prevotellaceae bacterium]
MEFKYYDVLSSLVVGCLILVVLISLTGYEYNANYSIPSIAITYILGYFLNTVGSLLESRYYWTIGGKPSDKQFYETKRCIYLLKNELGDDTASTEKIFIKSMSYSSNDNSIRVPDFNAQYTFSRTLLTYCDFVERYTKPIRVVDYT